jgi:Flp pilus assembly protein TadG
VRVARLATCARRDERGAVAVIVAICAILLFAGTAYAIDAGNLWTQRRHMVTAADASALAAAGDFAVGVDGCASTAAKYLTNNVSSATLEDCDHTTTSEDSGHVTVRGRTVADYTFAGIFGIDDKEVRATTSAEYGIPFAVAGLRPFGLCLYAGDPDGTGPLLGPLQTWLNLPTGPTGQSAPITITYAKSHPNDCGGNAPGNWGVMDFDGGANSNSDIQDWTLNGYPGEVSISPPTVEGDTGAFSNSLDTELSALKSSGAWFGLPVFDSVTGNGSNAEFRLVAFVSVKLVDFRANGTEANRYMTLVFDKGQLSGKCCDLNGIDTGVRVVRICDIDTLAPETSPDACG